MATASGDQLLGSWNHGAAVAAISGILLSLLLSSTFKRHLAAILRATQDI